MTATTILVTNTSEQTLYHTPVRIGVPFAKGAMAKDKTISLTDNNGLAVPFHFGRTANWPDGSAKWILLDLQTKLSPKENQILSLDIAQQTPTIDTLDETGTHCSTESGVVQLNQSTNVAKLKTDNTQILEYSGDNGAKRILSMELVFTPENGESVKATATRCKELETSNSLRREFTLEGTLEDKQASQRLEFELDFTFHANSSSIELSLTVQNPSAAAHPNGIWDLGDDGSVLFRDISIHLITDSICQNRWKLEENSDWIEDESGTGHLYQESSGGENFAGNNHKNRKGEIPHKLKGFTFKTQNGSNLAGTRANPILHCKTEESEIQLACKQFWQNFPKSLKTNSKGIILSLFPADYPDLHEMQGGEKKKHTFYLNLGNNMEQLTAIHSPPHVQIPLETFAETSAFPYFSEKSDDRMNALIEEGLGGDNNYFVKREIIDEFGWRNFGEVYADHEAFGFQGEQALVSHYNNQYDSLYGFSRQFARSGDPRWLTLMNDLAAHVADIDIYNTLLDRDEYNGGLFWHTDHYLDADTCSHRTYSRSHETDEEPGGGPGTEHCYTTGFLYHYFLTGSKESKLALLSLRNWIEKLHEGGGTILERLLEFKNKDLPLLKALASKAPVNPFKYPLTRGTGNYVSTLLDAFILTGDLSHLDLATRVIRQTVHPYENVEFRKLENIEITWSYSVFLQSVGKYLSVKESLNQYDEHFYYARDSLLLFANWMLTNEYPFLEKPEILDYPNHTWTAQDIRKANILYIAAYYTNDDSKRKEFNEKADYFHNYVVTTLKDEEERSFSRLLAILMQNQGPNLYYKDKQGSELARSADNKHPPIPRLSTGIVLRQAFVDLFRRLAKLSVTKELRWIQTRSQALAKLKLKSP